MRAIALVWFGLTKNCFSIHYSDFSEFCLTAVIVLFLSLEMARDYGLFMRNGMTAHFSP